MVDAAPAELQTTHAQHRHCTIYDDSLQQSKADLRELRFAGLISADDASTTATVTTTTTSTATVVPTSDGGVDVEASSPAYEAIVERLVRPGSVVVDVRGTPASTALDMGIEVGPSPDIAASGAGSAAACMASAQVRVVR